MTNLIILDASGSMSHKTDEVKGGLKELFKQIKLDYEKAEKKVVPRVIVADFSGAGDFNVLVDAQDLERLVDSIADKYNTRGMTALYDAMGKGFQMIDSDEKEVFVNVMTDGQENASREFSHAAIKALIADKKGKGWAITFMGTTEDAINSATSMGISAGNTFTFSDSKKGVSGSMKKMSNVRSTYYAATASAGGAGLESLDVNNLMANDKTDVE